MKQRGLGSIGFIFLGGLGWWQGAIAFARQDGVATDQVERNVQESNDSPMSVKQLLEFAAQTYAEPSDNSDTARDSQRSLRRKTLDALVQLGTHYRELGSGLQDLTELDAEIARLSLQCLDDTSEFNRLRQRLAGPISIGSHTYRSSQMNLRRALWRKYLIQWEEADRLSVAETHKKRVAAEGLLLIPSILDTLEFGTSEFDTEVAIGIALETLSRLRDATALPVIVERARLDLVVSGRPVSNAAPLTWMFRVSTQLTIADDVVDPDEIGYLLEMIKFAEMGEGSAPKFDRVFEMLVHAFKERGFTPVQVPEMIEGIPVSKGWSLEQLEMYRAIWKAAFTAYPREGLSEGQIRFLDAVTTDQPKVDAPGQ